MSHIEYEKAQKRKKRLKIASHLLAAVNIVLGFFCLFTFAAAMRCVIGLSTEIYYLSKAWWQQVAFIAVAILFVAVSLGGQHLYEKELIDKGRRLPIAFVVITCIELLFYAACRLLPNLYFSM